MFPSHYNLSVEVSLDLCSERSEQAGQAIAGREIVPLPNGHGSVCSGAPLECRGTRSARGYDAKQRSVLQARFDGQTAGEEGEAGEGVALALPAGKTQRPQADVGERDHGGHGGEGGESEHGDDTGDVPEAALGCGEHEQRDQRFAGTENEDRKEDPGRDGGHTVGAGVVDVYVVATVSVFVGMDGAVVMKVEVRVRSVSDGAVDAPNHVGQAERDQQPRRETTAGFLDAGQFAKKRSRIGPEYPP